MIVDGVAVIMCGREFSGFDVDDFEGVFVDFRKEFGVECVFCVGSVVLLEVMCDGFRVCDVDVVSVALSQ